MVGRYINKFSGMVGLQGFSTWYMLLDVVLNGTRFVGFRVDVVDVRL